MNSRESISTVLGSGAAIIMENAGDDVGKKKRPHLTIMYPEQLGVIINGGMSDQAVLNIPARSMVIESSFEVRALYEFLKSYYGES